MGQGILAQLAWVQREALGYRWVWGGEFWAWRWRSVTRFWPKSWAGDNARRSLAIVVQKYGGSSVADPEKIQQVARHVAATRSSGLEVVVVVSAMGKTTENLLALARTLASEPPRRELDMLVSTGERVTMALLSMALTSLGIDAVSFTGSQSGIITNDRHFDAEIVEVRPQRIWDELARDRVVIVAGYQGMSREREITT